MGRGSKIGQICRRVVVKTADGRGKGSENMCEPFEPFVLFRKTNPAQFRRMWAGLADVLCRQIANGFQDFNLYLG